MMRSLARTAQLEQEVKKWMSGFDEMSEANANLRADNERLEAENEALRKEVERLKSAISWALGEGDSDFRPREIYEGAYWWRTELRRRARPINPSQEQP